MYIWQYLLHLIHISAVYIRISAVYIHISAVYIRISAVYILSLTIFSSSSEPVSDSSVVGVWGEVLWVYSPKVIVTFKQEVYLLGFSLCKWCDCFCPEGALSPSSEVCSGDTELSSPTQNSTDEEKLIGMSHRMAIPSGMPDRLQPFTLENRWFLCAFVILCVSGSCVSFSVHLCLSRCCVSFFVHLCVTVCVCVSLSPVGLSLCTCVCFTPVCRSFWLVARFVYGLFDLMDRNYYSFNLIFTASCFVCNRVFRLLFLHSLFHNFYGLFTFFTGRTWRHYSMP